MLHGAFFRTCIYDNLPGWKKPMHQRGYCTAIATLSWLLMLPCLQHDVPTCRHHQHAAVGCYYAVFFMLC